MGTAWPQPVVPSRRRSGTGRLLAWAAAIGGALLVLFLAGGELAQLAQCQPVGSGVGATTAAPGSVAQPAPTAFARRDIPALYLALYERAGARYGVDWSVLAGVGWIECDHGRDRDPSCWREGAVNSAGAGGPMQFLATTWAVYGVDGDGRRDRWDPRDAVPAAARFLRAAGAPADYRRALFAYNHADWYVAAVLARARAYSGRPSPAAPAPAAPAPVAPALAPAALAPANLGGRFSFQDLFVPHVTVGWTARGWESSFDDSGTASGIPADGGYPGVSFWHLPTLRGYWAVTFPDQRTLVLRQIDTGPAAYLHRFVDVDYAAVVRAGYTVGSFPTGGPGEPGGEATAVYLGRGAQWAALDGAAVGGAAAPAQSSTSCPIPSGATAAGGTGGYVEPFLHAHVTPERIDQGVDYAGTGAIAAIGDGAVGYAAPRTGWPGEYIAYTLRDGPDAGRSIYVAEGIVVQVTAGQRVSAGQTLATFAAGSSTGIETGWAQGASGSWDPMAKVTGGYVEGQRTAAGDAFSHFLRALGAPGGLAEGRPIVGHF